MATIERWRWIVTDPASGRRGPTRWRMTEVDALATDPAAERVPGSRDVIEVPDDTSKLSTSAFQRPGENGRAR